jgi:hypothetical protein
MGKSKSCTFDGIGYRSLVRIVNDISERIPQLKPQADKLRLVMKAPEAKDDTMTFFVTLGDLLMMSAFSKLADGFNTVVSGEVWANPGRGSDYSFETLPFTETLVVTTKQFIDEWDERVS